MNVQTGVPTSSVLQGAGHVVFVEGSDDYTFDPTVIRELLKANSLMLEVKAIGPCDNVFQAAKAMMWKHPTYYFIADRDEKTLAHVERGWQNFHRPDTYNFLHWRKRELENYFIDPGYLEKCPWLIKTATELRDRILHEASARLFLEAANLVLLRIRSGLLVPPTAWFRRPELFRTRADALGQIQGCPELQQRQNEITVLLEPQNRERLLDEVLLELTGGKPTLEYGSGTWLDSLSGKEIFRAISGEVFRVEDASGNVLQGLEQNNEVAKSLLKQSLTDQPQDFQELVALLRAKVNAQP